MDLGFRMHAERTPNPNSIKWVLGQAVAGDVGTAAFPSAPSAPDAPAGAAAAPVDPAESPLAAAILEIEGTVGVFLGPTFVTVTKTEEAEWTELAAPIVAAIKAWAGSGEAALGPAWSPPVAAESGEVIERIREILERDVRPYVEQDGGEIQFAGYNDGVVEVVLQGACAGCPSSSITLKMGIEARLKEEIPEVKSVVAL